MLFTSVVRACLADTVVAYDVQQKQAAGFTVLSLEDAEKERVVAKIQSGTKRKQKRKR